MLSLYRNLDQEIDFYMKPELEKVFNIKVIQIEENNVVILARNLKTHTEEKISIYIGNSIELHESIYISVKQLLKNTAIFNFIVDDCIKVLRSELKLFK